MRRKIPPIHLRNQVQKANNETMAMLDLMDLPRDLPVLPSFVARADRLFRTLRQILSRDADAGEFLPLGERSVMPADLFVRLAKALRTLELYVLRYGMQRFK